MSRTLASLAALFTSMGILLLGGGLLGTLLAVRMGVEGLRSETIGLVMACYSVGFVLATLVCTRIIQKVGHIRCFAAFSALACCAALVHGLHVDPWLWAAMRILFGFSLAGIYMVTESWLNDRTPKEYRGRVLSIYIIVTSLALGSGQFLLNVWDVSGYQLFSLAAILMAVALVPVALTRVSSPELQKTRRVSLRRLYHISPLATYGAFASGLTNGAFYALGPVFAVAVGFPVNQIATFMGSTILGGLFLQYVIGRLSDRYDRRRVIMAVTALVAMVSVAIAMAHDRGIWIVVGLAVVWGGLNFTVYALALALANDFMTQEERIPASATMLLTHGIGMITGPIVLARVMGLAGPEGLFLGFAVIAVTIGLYGWYRNRYGEPLEVESQGAYRAAPQTMTATQYSVELGVDVEDPQLEFDFDAEESEPLEQQQESTA
ncbi:MFS family permease [Natronocella acetinitrilica]|uniref:MFS family permease n=1 Tax=Natronocella acetinitrilica TaxID=414046 RepID=A0AAE3G6W3_9GAMM|nr:MFS transporter [Natronocella acetinitrilica]MCP1674952.1 MFS family permease [Natronocella acetinitrilica]